MSQQRAADPLADKNIYEWNRALSQAPPVPRPNRPKRRRLVRVSVLTGLTLAAGAIAWLAAARPAQPIAAAPPSAHLTVDTRPTGASVSIDGVPKGVAPLTIVLAAGPHRIEVRHAAERREIPVTVAGGEHFSQYFEFQATPATGRLQIDSDPPGARVLVDGELRGAAPILVDHLIPGSHAVVLQSDMGSVDRQVTVDAGATGFIFVPLVSKGAPLSGWVAMTAPVELQIFENDRLIGTTATERVMMAAGRHEIQLVNDSLGYQAVRTLTVSPGRTVSVPIDLPQGTLHINAVPWAEVWIDGTRVGETPLGNLRVTIGPHEVVFRHPQLGEQRHGVSVTVSKPARLSVNLGD